MFGVLPDDPKIKDMNPVHKWWMYQNWIADQNDQVDLTKNQAYLIGSFTNPEAVKKMLSEDNSTTTTTDEEFEDSWSMVQSTPASDKKHRRRRKVKG